jgi:pimeloyl-ACP methyl ester carboxylesterase
MKTKTLRICLVALAIICNLTVAGGSFLSVNAQQHNSNQLPILLIHGYGEDSSVWNLWKGWLAADNFSEVYSITFSPITFRNDECGSVAKHATELSNIVNKILHDTGSEKVDIVAHSKGGLDARWYIANDGADKVANLIMIGTPNSGSPAAWVDITGCPFGSDRDLLPGSAATRVIDQPQTTHYYTLVGNWLPLAPCLTAIPGIWVPDGSNCFILGNDDSLVPVYSAEASPFLHYTSLGQPFPYNHFALLKHREVFDKVIPILNGQ